MAKDPNDGDYDEDPLTQINVDVEPSSLISAITITRPGGGAPIVAASASPSQADTEPNTLEPQLSVRGLAPSSVQGQGPAHVPGSVEAPGGGAPPDDDDDKTTGSIDARLREAYESARSVEDAIAHTAPSPRAHGPIIITPSEPFRATSPQISEMPRSSQQGTHRRPAAPIPAAGRPPPSTDPEIAEPTVKRAPYALTNAAFAETLQSSSGLEDAVTATGDDVDDDDDDEVAEEDDETATDAMGTKRSESHEELSLSDALPTGDEDDEEDETRTQHDVGRALRAMDGGPIGSLPATTRDLVGLDEARSARREMPPSSAGFPAATPVALPPPAASPPLAAPPAPAATSTESGPNTSGATIRMMFNASLGAVMINPPPPDPGPAPPPPHHASVAPGYTPSSPPLGLAADPHRVVPAPGPTVRRPPTPRFDPLAKPKRSRGRRVFFFLVFVAAGGAGYTYRHRVTPWVMKHLPAAAREWIAPRAPPPPPPMATPPDPSASASASASASTSSSASASPSASASASPSASASASASPSSSAPHGKKRPRR